MFELVSGCWSRGPPCAKGGRDSSPRLAGCWLGSYGSLCKLVLGSGGGMLTPGVPLGFMVSIFMAPFLSNASYAPRFCGALGYSFGPRG